MQMVIVFYMFGKPDKIANNIAKNDKGSDLGSSGSVRRQILWVRWVPPSPPSAPAFSFYAARLQA